MLRSIKKIGLTIIVTFFTICLFAQEGGFVSKSNKAKDDKYSNTWAEAKKDSIDHDSTTHVFGSYNFRDDKDIPFRAKRQIKKGDLFYSLGPGKYDKAMKHYKKAYKIDPNIAYLDFKIGQCYLLMRQQKFKSILYLEKAYHQNKRVDKEIHYYLGRAHQVNDDYIRAIEEYEKSKSEYKKAHRKDHISLAEKHEHLELIDKHIEECKFAMLLKEDPKKVLIESVGDSVNTTFADYDPFVTADESMMIFTSRRKGTRGGGRADIDHVYYEDLYVSYNKNGFWTQAKPMKNKFNKHTNDAVIGMSHDGKELFVYRDTKQGDIYLAPLDGDTYGRPKPIKEINTGYHESSACFSFDKKTLYFVSDKPGGYGGRDIYKSELQEDGKWGEPENMGRPLNTKYDEERIFLHPNGKILFFCSKGHNSMGGYDIFFSELDENGKWGEPQNMGFPINGPDDDISFVTTATGETGYFASYRPNGTGDRDIYSIRFGISSKIGTLNREDDILSKRKVLDKDEFIAELIKIGIDPMELEDVLPILPDETMEHLQDMIEQWDQEIAELLALVDSVEDKKELIVLEEQITVKKNELTILKTAANPLKIETLDNQITLRQNDLDSLQARLDSTSKKKEIKLLEDQIQAKKNELALLNSVYIREKDSSTTQNLSIAELSDEAKVLQDELLALEEKASEATDENERKALEDQIAVKQEELNQLQSGAELADGTNVSANESTTTSVNDNISQKEVEIAQLQEQMKAANSEEEKQQIQDQITTAENELAQLMELSESSSIADNNLNTAGNDSQGAIDLNEQIIAKQNEVAMLQDQLSTASTNEEKAQIEAQLKAAENELAQLMELSESSSVVNNNLNAAGNNAQGVAELNDQITAKQNEVAILQDQLSTASTNEEKAQIEAQLKAAENELAQLMELSESSSIADNNLNAAGNDSQGATDLNDQIIAKQNEIAALQAQYDAAISEHQRQELEQKIKLAENELAEMMSVANNSETTNESPTIEMSSNQSVGNNETNETGTFSPTLQMTESSGVDAMNISNDELYLVEYQGKYTAYSQDELDEMTGETSSAITQENMAINDLKKKIAMTEDKKQRVTYEAELEVREKKVEELRQEMDALLDAETVADNLNSGETNSEQKQAIEEAAEKAKITMAENQAAELAAAQANEQSNTESPNMSGNESQGTSESSGTEPLEVTETQTSNNEQGNNTASSSTEQTESQTTGGTAGTIGQGESIVLENVLFDFDKSTLRSESYETLDNLVEIMNAPPATSKVELSGHTDSKGSAEYNQKLSERRAQAVVDYLISKGIAKDRLVAKGYGESRPAAPNSNPDGTDNPEGRQLNRRTELKLLKE